MPNFFGWNTDLIPGVNVGQEVGKLFGGNAPSGFSPNAGSGLGGGGGGGGGWSNGVLGASTSTNTPNGTGSYAATGPSVDTAALAQYDQAIAQYNNSLGRLPGQLDVARSNINTQYGINQNELNSSKDQAQNSYNTSVTQNQQNLRGDKNTINDQASAGLRGLLRSLGAYGAGGSSDAAFVAPRAVADQASMQRAGAGQTFAQNAQGLDTNWNNFLTEDQNSRRKLDDWRTQQLNSAQAQSETTKQDLLTKLAGLASQRAAAAGGNATASAQPYLDQAQALNSSIDSLGRLSPTYTGTTPVYNAPTLGSYDTGRGTAAQIDPATAGGASPFLAMLLGQNRDKFKALA